MNLLDLFEALKPSDIPTSMRQNRLTMRDIEKERPQGAYRYRVIQPTAGESPREFLDLRAAQEFAAAVKGRVETIREEDKSPGKIDKSEDPCWSGYHMVGTKKKAGRTVPNCVPGKKGATMEEAQVQEALPWRGTPESVGYMYISELMKTEKTHEPVTLDYGGGNRIRIVDPNIKEWFRKKYQEAESNPRHLEAFLINMGTIGGMRALLQLMQKEPKDDLNNQSQGIAENNQKKSLQLDEAETADLTPRAQRFMQQVRMRQPQARNDIEALIYDYNKQQRQDRRDIERLEKETGDLESDIRQDLEKAVGSLKGRKGISQNFLDQIRKSDQEQDAAIQRIMQLDRDQQNAIDDLDKVVAQGAKQSRATSAPYAPTITPRPSAEPSTTAAPLATPAASNAVASKTDIEPETQRFGRAVSNLAGRGAANQDQIAQLRLTPSPPGQTGTVDAQPRNVDAQTTSTKDTETPDLFQQDQRKVAEMNKNLTQSFAVKIARHGPNEEPVR